MNFFGFGKRAEVADPDHRLLTDGGWISESRKIGTAEQDAKLVFSQLAYDELSKLADFDWLARRIVRLLPEAAWQHELIFAKETDLQNWQKINAVPGNDDGAFLTAAIWARTHGASILIKGHMFSGSLETPLPEKPGAIEFLEPVSVKDFEVLDEDLYRDKDDPKTYKRPEFYTITGTHRLAGIRIHESRVVHFSGAAPSSEESVREPNKMTGLSVLDTVQQEVESFGLTWASVQTMCVQASVPVMAVKGLIAGLSSNSKETKARLQLLQEMLSSNKLLLLDADAGESYRRESVNFADVPQILQQLCLRIASAGGIPAQELFGRLISGLGDTGEGETQKWSRTIRSYRTRTLSPRIREILGPDVEFDFAPISEPEPKDWADTVQSWWHMGMLTDRELRKHTEKALTLPEATEETWAELQRANSAPALPEANEGDDDEGDAEGAGAEAKEKDKTSEQAAAAEADPDEAKRSASPSR